MTVGGTRYRLLGMSGSLRAQAYSTAVLQALAAAVANQADIDYADIGALPHFNQDLYVEPLPEAVARLRNQIAHADAIVVSSPEYNHGIPGVLKNAIDWVSRPHNGSPLKGKPVLSSPRRTPSPAASARNIRSARRWCRHSRDRSRRPRSWWARSTPR